MALKIPDIAQQPVGEFALGNIRQPDYQALGTAAGEFKENEAGCGSLIDILHSVQ